MPHTQQLTTNHSASSLGAASAANDHSQNTAFEFKPVGQQAAVQQPSSKAYVNPFTAGLVRQQPAAAATADVPVGRMMVDQMASPEPSTPASITSESRGGPSGPPLTTLASLSKQQMSPSDSDTVTPLVNMRASHVPLSTYSGSPAGAAEGAKKAGKIVWGDILMWRQPLQTATVFVGGLAAFGLLTFAAYGAHKMTLMSGEWLLANTTADAAAAGSRPQGIAVKPVQLHDAWVGASVCEAASSSTPRMAQLGMMLAHTDHRTA